MWFLIGLLTASVPVGVGFYWAAETLWKAYESEIDQR